MAPCHLLVTEKDRIKALIGSFPMKLRVGENRLNLRGIGTVSVHPGCRGKGYMKLLLKQLVEEAEADGTDLVYLGGQRQRYGYFGFGQAATQLVFTVTPPTGGTARPFPPRRSLCSLWMKTGSIWRRARRFRINSRSPWSGRSLHSARSSTPRTAAAGSSSKMGNFWAMPASATGASRFRSWCSPIMTQPCR